MPFSENCELLADLCSSSQSDIDLELAIPCFKKATSSYGMVALDVSIQVLRHPKLSQLLDIALVIFRRLLVEYVFKRIFSGRL